MLYLKLILLLSNKIGQYNIRELSWMTNMLLISSSIQNFSYLLVVPSGHTKITTNYQPIIYLIRSQFTGYFLQPKKSIQMITHIYSFVEQLSSTFKDNTIVYENTNPFKEFQI
jgi:hypothetical protein